MAVFAKNIAQHRAPTEMRFCRLFIHRCSFESRPNPIQETKKSTDLAIYKVQGDRNGSQGSNLTCLCLNDKNFTTCPSN